MFRLTAFACLLAASSSVPLTAQETRSIAEGQTLSGTLAAESEHEVTLALQAGQFVYGVVDQLDVNVVVTITSDEGPVGRFNASSRQEERFTFESEDSGTFTIRLVSFEDGGGEYTITIHRIEDIADDPEDRVDQLMIAYDDDETPGAIVGVVEDGRLVFEKAYGMANLTWDVPFDEGMRSNIGSVTKQFTSMGLVLLEQEGKLSLDDEVRTHIPELPDFGSPVTLRNLLNHVGGYREVYNAFGMMGYGGEDDFPREKVIQLVQRQPDLQAPPNTEFNYNNTGYILVSMTIERVSGMSFQDYMQKRVFEPLGMTNTLLTNHQGQIIPNSGMGYVPAEQGGYRQARDLPAAAGAGGIYTTAEDMAKWMLNYRDHTLGGAEAIEAITTNTILESGDSTGYGLGLGLATHRGRALWTHTGGDVAHRTYFGWYPELESGVFVSSNNAGFPTSIGRPLAEAFFGDEMEPEETAADIVAAEMSDERKEAIVGLWRLAAGLEIDIEVADGDLRATPQGQPTTVLVPTSDSTVSITGVDASVTFRFEVDGSTRSAVLHQGGENPMSRVEQDDELTPAMLRAYEGRYWSDEVEVAFELMVEDGELVAHNIRLPSITLQPGATDTFAAGAVGAFEFKRSGNGEVTGFMVNNARTKDVWFEREWVPGG
jgi:CubicO group peptidase (beta-lactamase class C family)